MRKLFAILILFLGIHPLSAQKLIEPTNEFIVEGLVKKTCVFNLDSLRKYQSQGIDSIVITNHLGERKSTLKNIRVFPLKNFLDKIEITVESPKQLSEFYFIFIASDGYKVVFSWNEIFNNKLGNGIYVIVEKEGKKIENLDDRISVLSISDMMTGRRYVKGLKKIIVKRVD